MIYRADITTENDHIFYYDTSEITFKQRHSNHNRAFKHAKSQHATELAEYIWQLKSNKFNYSIKWSIPSKVYGYADSLSWKHFLMEKYWIIKTEGKQEPSNKIQNEVEQDLKTCYYHFTLNMFIIFMRQCFEICIFLI